MCCYIYIICLVMLRGSDLLGADYVLLYIIYMPGDVTRLRPVL